MYEVSKEFTFDAAHRLVYGYQGKCKHVHGHSWKVTVHLKSRELDKFGMVRDFGDIKILRKWVDDNLDHATIVSDTDSSLIEWLITNEQRKFLIRNNPTSENLCTLIYQQAHKLGLKEVYAVEINETCTSKARYEHGV